MFCGRRLFPTFPEDRSGPLPTCTDEYLMIVAANMTRPPRPVTHRRTRRSSVQPSDYQSSDREVAARSRSPECSAVNSGPRLVAGPYCRVINPRPRSAAALLDVSPELGR
jgi:hypothetical protein